MKVASNNPSPAVSPKLSPEPGISAPASPASKPASPEPVANGHVDTAAMDAKQAELDDLRSQMDALKKDEADKADSVQAKLSALEADIEKLEAETDSLRKKESDNVDTMQRLQEEKKRLELAREAKIESLEAEAEALQTRTDETKQRISAFEKGVRGEESVLQKAVDAARGALEKQQEQNAEKMRTAQNEAGTLPLEEKVASLEESTSKMKVDLEGQLASLSTVKESLEEAKTQLETQTKAFTTLLEETEAELKELKDASQASQDQANALTAETNRQIDASSQRKHEIQALETEVKLLQQRKVDMKAKTEAVGAQLADLKAKTVECNQRKFRAENEVKKVQTKSGHAVDDERARVEKLSKTVTKEREKVATAQQNAASLKTQFEQQFQHEVQRAKAARTQGKQNEIKEEKRVLEEQKADNDQLRIRVKALEGAVYQERQKMREITSRNKLRI